MASVEVFRNPMRLPSLGAGGIYEGRFQDRNPHVRAAGKLTTAGESAKQCLDTIKRPESPEIVRRFRASQRPEAGRSSIFYGRAGDPHRHWAKDMTHGVCIPPSIVAKELVNPQPVSLFHLRLMNKKDDIYASQQRAPLGRSPHHLYGLPAGMDATKITFGIKTERDGSAGELVNPDKSWEQVNLESEGGRDLYRETHFDFKVGEQCNRKYCSPSFDSAAQFGTPTPHANDGRNIRRTLHWTTGGATGIVSKRLDDFRERTQPQLGQVHDPIKDTLTVAPDHTFGVLVKPDEYGVGDLLHGRSRANYLRGKDRVRGVVAAMRQHLKKANYHNFPSLLAAFHHYDKNDSGLIDINELRQVCLQFNLPAEPELLEQLMDSCDLDHDGKINYAEFVNFLNWKDKLPSGLPFRAVASAPAGSLCRTEDPAWGSAPARLQKQIDAAIGNHRTSSSMINAVVGGLSTRDYRCYGVPTVRTDLPAPRIKRVSDRTNYSDESDAYGLINPSIYSKYGLAEREFLIPRRRFELRQIFNNIGVAMADDEFYRLYDQAAADHPQGHVSVESFKHQLDVAQAADLEGNPDTSIAY